MTDVDSITSSSTIHVSIDSAGAMDFRVPNEGETAVGIEVVIVVVALDDACNTICCDNRRFLARWKLVDQGGISCGGSGCGWSP